MKILLVEDDPLNALEVETLAEKLGHQFLTTIDNGKEALEFIHNHSVDLIIMDINIRGELSGIEVAQRLKKKQIPIIFITAYTDEETYLKAAKTQPCGFIVKPFDHLTLRSCIEVTIRNYLQNSNPDITKNGLYIRVNRQLLKLDYDAICWIQADGNYVYIQTLEKKYALKSSLARLLKKLDETTFIRIHKSFVINLNKLKSLSLENNSIVLENQVFPVGRKYKKELLERLEAY